MGLIAALFLRSAGRFLGQFSGLLILIGFKGIEHASLIVQFSPISGLRQGKVDFIRYGECFFLTGLQPKNHTVKHPAPVSHAALLIEKERRRANLRRPDINDIAYEGVNKYAHNYYQK